jgi:hypothetical protein
MQWGLGFVVLGLERMLLLISLYFHQFSSIRSHQSEGIVSSNESWVTSVRIWSLQSFDLDVTLRFSLSFFTG